MNKATKRIMFTLLFPFFLAVVALTSTMALAVENEVLSIIGRWKVNLGGGAYDYMSAHFDTTPSPPPGSTFEGQTFYAPKSSATGNHPLFKHFNAILKDSMDAAAANVAGYTNQGVLGFPFNTQYEAMGTCSIDRYYKSPDHATAFCSNDSTYGPVLPAGYTREGSMGYGFPRYGKQYYVPRYIYNQDSSISIGINLAAGGAVFELNWGGKQFINTYDYGRELQIAVFFDSDGNSNPTEAGDEKAHSDQSNGYWHGSPLISYTLVNTSPEQYLTTMTYPLQWNPENFGGDANHPVRWTGTVSKRVDMDVNGWSNVIRWTTGVTTPPSISYNYYFAEIPTAYLNSEFTNFYVYDATVQTPQLEQLNVTDSEYPGDTTPDGTCISSGLEPALGPDAGGVILSTADGNHALGMYRRKPNYNDFFVCNLLSVHGVSKISVLEIPQTTGLPAGSYNYTSYLIVGTRDNVANRMQDLYTNDY